MRDCLADKSRGVVSSHSCAFPNRCIIGLRFPMKEPSCPIRTIQRKPPASWASATPMTSSPCGAISTSIPSSRRRNMPRATTSAHTSTSSEFPMSALSGHVPRASATSVTNSSAPASSRPYEARRPMPTTRTASPPSASRSVATWMHYRLRKRPNCPSHHKTTGSCMPVATIATWPCSSAPRAFSWICAISCMEKCVSSFSRRRKSPSAHAT